MNSENLIIEALDTTPKGGQHCGIIPRGVKVTHKLTGLTASCATERSQMKNRNIAIAMIEWGLLEMDGIL